MQIEVKDINLISHENSIELAKESHYNQLNGNRDDLPLRRITDRILQDLRKRKKVCCLRRCRQPPKGNSAKIHRFPLNEHQPQNLSHLDDVFQEHKVVTELETVGEKTINR